MARPALNTSGHGGMLPKPILIVGGSVVAIILGNTQLGPIVALLLVAVIAYTALTSTTFNQSQ